MDTEKLQCFCGCGLNRFNPELLGRMKLIEEITGHEVIVESGCRCALWNRTDAIQGVLDSFHLPGLDRTNDRDRMDSKNLCDALDWRIEDKTIMSSVNILLHKIWEGGWHHYPDKGIIHCDLGPMRRWA